MAASTTTHDPSPGMQLKDENDEVSLEQALQSLGRAQDLLDSSKDKNEEWHNPLEILDTTAAALDEAGLAMKSHSSAQEQDEENYLRILILEQLVESVAKGRNAIIEATRSVTTGKWLEDIPDDELLIVWATQTGTSKKFALSLRDKLGGQAVNINELTLADLQKRRKVFFICSTFGCGRPPRDAEIFFSTLQVLGGKEGSITILFGLEFVVVALGNSKFNTFCKFGHELRERLQKLGAKEILPITVLDAKNGKSEQRKAFAQWQNQILTLEGKATIAKDNAVVRSRKRRQRTHSAASTTNEADLKRDRCVIS